MSIPGKLLERSCPCCSYPTFENEPCECAFDMCSDKCYELGLRGHAPHCPKYMEPYKTPAQCPCLRVHVQNDSVTSSSGL